MCPRAIFRFLLFLLLLVPPSLTAAQERRWKGRIRSDDAEKHLIEQVTPVTPENAKATWVGGKVDLAATVSSTGEVVDLKVLRGHPLLVPAVLEAVRKWKYRPFLKDGSPVEEQIEIEVLLNREIPPDETEAFATFSRNFSQGLGAYRRGDMIVATQAFRKAIETGDHFQHRRYLEFSTCLTFLGQIYLDERRYAEAEPLLLRGLSLRELHQAPDESEVAEVLDQLASLYFRTKRYELAEARYRRSVSIWEASLIDTHITELVYHYTRSLAFDAWNLANLYAGSRRLPNAETSYRQAVEAGSRVFRTDEMDKLLEDYARFLRLVGRKDEISEVKSRARKLMKDPANRLPRK